MADILVNRRAFGLAGFVPGPFTTVLVRMDYRFVYESVDIGDVVFRNAAVTDDFGRSGGGWRRAWSSTSPHYFGAYNGEWCIAMEDWTLGARPGPLVAMAYQYIGGTEYFVHYTTFTGFQISTPGLYFISSTFGKICPYSDIQVGQPVIEAGYADGNGKFVFTPLGTSGARRS